jgi:hypothetical protein
MKKNWIEKPTAKQAIILISIGLIGDTLLLCSMTNFFTESAFQKQNITLWFLFFASISTVLHIGINYFKTKIGKN